MPWFHRLKIAYSGSCPDNGLYRTFDTQRMTETIPTRLARFKQPSTWLWIGSAALFLGKVIQSGVAGTAIVEFLGYESWLSGIVGRWMSWEAYAIQVYPKFSEYAAGFWTIGYLVALAGMFLPRTWRWTIWMGAILLLLEAVMATAGQFYWAASFLEKSLMFMAPILYLSARYHLHDQWIRWVFVGRWAVGVVFVIHGLYALDIFPLPGYWIEMVSMATGISGEWAGIFLHGIGLLDIFSALWVVLRPNEGRLVWYYLISWGLLTALGRVLGFLMEGYFLDTLVNWGYETMIRLPHGLIPLALYMEIWKD